MRSFIVVQENKVNLMLSIAVWRDIVGQNLCPPGVDSQWTADENDIYRMLLSYVRQAGRAYIACFYT